MLEHLPPAIGRALSGTRAGTDALTLADPGLAPPGHTIAALTLQSPAFPEGGPIPERFTEDGDGVSPPLRWSDVPPGTAALLLLVEDADSPTPKPLVHAIVPGLEAHGGALAEGAIGDEADAGRNSFLSQGWLPPDPPPGHGPHRYVFQLYALNDEPALAASAGRGAVLDAIRGHVIAVGTLVGTFERPE